VQVTGLQVTGFRESSLQSGPDPFKVIDYAIPEADEARSHTRKGTDWQEKWPSEK